MKIAVVASWPRSLLNFRGPLLSAMAKGGHEVIAFGPVAPTPILDRLRSLGLSGYRAIPLDRAGMNPVRDLGTVMKLVAEFRSLRPDLVFAYTAKPVVYGSLAARVARVPRVFPLITGLGYAFTDQGDLGMRRRLLNRVLTELYRLALGSATAVFFQNRDDRELFLELGLVPRHGRAVVTHGSGVDLEHFALAAPRVAPLVFLQLGRLLHAKGVREYVEAAELVARRHPDLRFRFVGGGAFDSPDLIPASTVARWAAGPVEFTDWVEDVRSCVAEASVYVLPSYREGTPRSVLEAMAMGRAIVTTDVPGCRDTVQDGVNGFLVPPRDSRALARAFERFVERPELVAEMGQQSRRLAEERFDVHRVNAQMLEVMGIAGGAPG